MLDIYQAMTSGKEKMWTGFSRTRRKKGKLEESKSCTYEVATIKSMLLLVGVPTSWGWLNSPWQRGMTALT